MIHTRTPCNLGFDGRIFLTEEEWMTYRKRKPVRYIRKWKLDTCEVCGKGVIADNPFQSAHKIGFDLGIIELALTPEFIDGGKNIVTAHRKTCNKAAEIDIKDAIRFLLSIGIVDLPVFLPHGTRLLWADLKAAV